MQSTLTKDGFCYEKCDFNGESEYTLHAGRNKAYYYSFETGKKTELNTPDGALEYINGTPELYISSTQASADEDGGSADIFIKEKDKYREINLNSIVDAGAARDAEDGDASPLARLDRASVRYAGTEAWIPKGIEDRKSVV